MRRSNTLTNFSWYYRALCITPSQAALNLLGDRADCATPGRFLFGGLVCDKTLSPHSPIITTCYELLPCLGVPIAAVKHCHVTLESNEREKFNIRYSSTVSDWWTAKQTAAVKHCHVTPESKERGRFNIWYSSTVSDWWTAKQTAAVKHCHVTPESKERERFNIWYSGTVYFKWLMNG